MIRTREVTTSTPAGSRVTVTRGPSLERVTVTAPGGARTIVTTGDDAAALQALALALLTTSAHDGPPLHRLELAAVEGGTTWTVTAELGIAGPHHRPHLHPPQRRDARGVLRALRCTDLATAPPALAALLTREGLELAPGDARGALARTAPPTAPEAAARALGAQGARGLALLAALDTVRHALTT